MDFKIDPRSVFSHTTNPATTKQNRQLQRLREAATDLETNFVNEMYKAMRKTVPEDGLFQKNSGEKMFEEMQDMECAKATSKYQSIGLADAIYNQMAPFIINRK